MGDGIGTEDEVALTISLGDPDEKDLGAGEPPPLQAGGRHGRRVGDVAVGRERDAIENLLDAHGGLAALGHRQRRGDAGEVEAGERLADENTGLGPTLRGRALAADDGRDGVDRVAEAAEHGPGARGIEGRERIGDGVRDGRGCGRGGRALAACGRGRWLGNRALAARLWRDSGGLPLGRRRLRQGRHDEAGKERGGRESRGRAPIALWSGGVWKNRVAARECVHAGRTERMEHAVRLVVRAIGHGREVTMVSHGPGGHGGVWPPSTTAAAGMTTPPSPVPAHGGHSPPTAWTTPSAIIAGACGTPATTAPGGRPTTGAAAAGMTTLGGTVAVARRLRLRIDRRRIGGRVGILIGAVVGTAGREGHGRGEQECDDAAAAAWRGV
jgi:hypothetical protein